MRITSPPRLRAALLFAVISSTVFVFGTAAAVAEESVSVEVLGKGEMAVPAEFKRTQPKSRIVEHEFQVGADDATARLTMMAAGGSVEANIKRWKGQFSGGDEAAQKSKKLDVGKWEIHLVDVSGTYAESMGGGPFAPGKVVQRPDYAMVGAIMVEPEGRQYFVKMIGPSDVVKASRDKFVAMIKSVAK